MAVDDVVSLLGELRSAQGRIAKARVLARGIAVLRELTPDERRRVALAVAQRTAPGLVPEIVARTGLDLDTSTVTEVLDLARDLDEDEIEQIIARLRDPDDRWDVLEDLGAPPPRRPPEQELPVLDAAQEREPEPEEQPAEGQVTSPPAVPPEQPRLVEEPPPAVSDGEPADSRPRAVEVETTPVTEPEVVVLPDGSDVVDRVRSAASSLAKLREVRHAGRRIRELGPEGRLRLVRALPDGWVRRRAVERMLELDTLATGDCLAVIRTFERAGDRNWVAASMVHAGLIASDDLTGVVDDRARKRLATRRT